MNTSNKVKKDLNVLYLYKRNIKYFMKKCVDVARKAFPQVDLLCAFYLASKRNNEIVRLKPKTVKSYCGEYGGKIHIVEEEKDRVVYEPAYYRKTVGKEHIISSKDIYIAELTDVAVHGGTGVMLSGKYALTDMVDNGNRVNITFGAIRRGKKNSFYVEVNKNEKKIETAINLCGLASFNYYHLTVEILSRYEYIKKYLGKTRIPVLMDEETRKYPQYEELIRCVLGESRIVFVSKYDIVYCKTLIYPSMNTWVPINIKRNYKLRVSDNCVSESAIYNIRKASKGLIKNTTNAGGKVYISRRNTQLSRVINEDEVEMLFRKAGYKIVRTERLTYAEQVEMFSSASCIVGASGAALTNIIYCNMGAVVGCIIPREYGFWVYSSIAHLVGCDCLFLDAKVVKKGKSISTERCYVDLDECRGYIEELESIIQK